MATTKVASIGRVVLFVLIFGACSSRPCREPRSPELDRTKTSTPVAAVPVTEANLNIEKGSATTVKNDALPELVRVYKPDGSRQCEKKPGVAVDIMERELAGIEVISRVKRKDGLMHIQVCGSPSGMINVFEIKATYLKQAEQRGFKRLED